MGAALRGMRTFAISFVIALGMLAVLFIVFLVQHVFFGGALESPPAPPSSCRDSIKMQVALESQVKESLRDPDSFELISYGGGMIDADGTQPILMKFRARNGFGGMNVEAVRATVQVYGCRLVDWKLLR